MDAMLLVESNMLAAATFGLDGIPKEPIVTIASVGREEQKAEKKGEKGERWGVLRFVEPWAKPYKVNKTARKALILMYGRETDQWVGKKIQLYALPGIYFGESGLAVRIKGGEIAAPVSFQMRKFGGGHATYNLVPIGPGPKASPGSAAPAAPAAAAPAVAPAAPPVAAPPPKVARKPDVAPAQQPPPPAATTGEPPAADPGPKMGDAFLGPKFEWGPHKGKSIEHADEAAVLEAIELGIAKCASEPDAKWAPTVAKGIEVLRLDMERRMKIRNAPQSPATREPGSDDGDETPAPGDPTKPNF